MIIALKKETDPNHIGHCSRFGFAHFRVGNENRGIFLFIIVRTDGTMKIKTHVYLGGKEEYPELIHYDGPIRDIKTGVIAGEKDVSIHVQKTRAFVTIANA